MDSVDCEGAVETEFDLISFLAKSSWNGEEPKLKK
jgi:hypothetical protein